MRGRERESEREGGKERTILRVRLRIVNDGARKEIRVMEEKRNYHESQLIIES